MTHTNNFEYLLGGKTRINRIGYGAMQLTGPGVFGDVTDRENAIKLLQATVENGINFIDTANAYGPDTNEILIADALSPYSNNLVIATKGGFTRPAPSQWVANGNPDHIEQAIENSLKHLRVKQITLWQLHRIDSNFPLEETLRPVANAVRDGKIKYVGLSEVDIDDIKRAEKILPIASIQNRYNIADRKWDEVLDYTNAHSIAFIPWFPLASGPDKITGVIKKIALRHHASIAQIALAWLLKRSDNILLIPGTKSIDHLLENIKVIDINLAEDEFQELSAG